MKKASVLFLLFVLSFLVACGDGNNGNNNGSINGNPPEANDNQDENGYGSNNEGNDPDDANNQEETGLEGSGNYELVDSIPIDGHVSTIVFDVNAEGDTVLWGEQDNRFDNVSRTNLWVDGEVTNLDFELGERSFLTRSGKVIRNDTDWDLPVEERHAILEYDPATGETERLVMDNDWDEILTPFGTNYTEDPRMYISQTEYGEELIMYVWNLDENEITEIDLTEALRTETDEEIGSYPRVAMSEDQSQLIVMIFNVGILVYDFESESSEFVYTTDNLYSNNEVSGTGILTTDERYVLYSTFDENDDLTHYAYDMESGDTIEIGMGITTIPLDDGNVMLINDDRQFYYFDFETNELEEAYHPELTEDESVAWFSISADASTIAYVARDGNDSVLHILKQ